MKDRKVTGVREAIKVITGNRNLFRVPNTKYCRERYFCSHHNKFHKYTFHQRIVFTIPFMIGFDTKEEVIDEANRLLIKGIVKEG